MHPFATEGNRNHSSGLNIQWNFKLTYFFFKYRGNV